MKKMFTLLAAFGFYVSAISQTDNSLNSKEVPTEVISAFTAKYPRIQSVRWYKDEDAYAAKFYKRGEPYTVRFNQSGTWLDEARKVSFAELRNKVQHSFSQGRFAGWQAHEVIEIQERNKEARYRIHIRNAHDQSERYIYYDVNGKFKKEESI